MARLLPPLALLVFAAFYVQNAFALQFTPAESEWASWPEYCRARYVVSGAGRNSEFVTRVPRAQSDMWERSLGDAWYGLHHFCAALIYTQRARAAPSEKERTFLLDTALRNFRFTLERTSETNGMYPEMLTRMATAYDLLKDEAHAMEYLDHAIELHPDYLGAYTAKAMIYRRKGDLDKARETLEGANKQSKGESAEIQYVLGLVCLEAKDYAAAQEHARIAYSLGHPLPGLRQKLAAAGHPIE
jgi:tetratricopeptide (TPR) repeat protein